MERLLVIDDDDVIRNSLVELLKKDYLVSGASSSCEALEILNENQMDLCILDVNLGNESGYELCKTIRKQYRMPIIFLTVRDDEDSLEQAILCGGDDYLTKPFSMRELRLRILAHLRRSGYVHGKERILKADGWTLNVDACTLHGTQDVEITSMELYILEILMENRGCLIPRGRLLELIDDKTDGFVEDNTLSVYISRLRSKMNRSGLQCPIETVRGIGYRWKGTV